MKEEIKLFDRKTKETVTYTRDLEKNPYDMHDLIAAMKLQLAETKLSEKNDAGTTLIKDLENEARAIAKFASDHFLSQFTGEDAMGIDPKYQMDIIRWSQRSMGFDSSENEDDDSEEGKK